MTFIHRLLIDLVEPHWMHWWMYIYLRWMTDKLPSLLPDVFTPRSNVSQIPGHWLKLTRVVVLKTLFFQCQWQQETWDISDFFADVPDVSVHGKWSENVHYLNVLVIHWDLLMEEMWTNKSARLGFLRFPFRPVRQKLWPSALLSRFLCDLHHPLPTSEHCFLLSPWWELNEIISEALIFPIMLCHSPCLAANNRQIELPRWLSG